MQFQEMKEEVHKFAIRAYRSGLMAGTSGNFSLRDTENQVVAITPSGLDYEEMTPDDIVLIDLQGNQIEGKQAPSSEWQMHNVIYENMNINAVAHTHSPYATCFSVLNETIPVVLIEMVLLGGDVPVAPFAMSGSKDLGVVVADTLKTTGRSACLLQNHGTLSIGETLEQAYTRAVYLEDAAKIYHYSRAVGEPKIVAKHHIKEMISKLGMPYYG